MNSVGSISIVALYSIFIPDDKTFTYLNMIVLSCPIFSYEIFQRLPFRVHCRNRRTLESACQLSPQFLAPCTVQWMMILLLKLDVTRERRLEREDGEEILLSLAVINIPLNHVVESVIELLKRLLMIIGCGLKSESASLRTY